jgi:hypothetical protein
MGQQRSVMVFRLVARATVEERMLQVGTAAGAASPSGIAAELCSWLYMCRWCNQGQLCNHVAAVLGEGCYCHRQTWQVRLHEACFLM